MKDSTKNLFRKHGWRIDRGIHNYLYFIFYHPYVKAALAAGRFVDRYFSWAKPLGRVWRFVFERYHGKVLSPGDTEKILTVREDVLATSEKNKKIIPFHYAYKIILRDPEHIVVMDCPCKAATGAPADTINSCLAIGKDIGRFWLDNCGKYHPRKISQDEALALVKRLRERGHLNQAFFKVATGGSSVGVLCCCHPDTCVSLISSRITQKFDRSISQVAASGYSVRRDESVCEDCGTCARVCPFGAVRHEEGRHEYRSAACMGCALCVENCPAGALSLYQDSGKSLPLDLDLVKEQFADDVQRLP
jgi:ferredoxin